MALSLSELKVDAKKRRDALNGMKKTFKGDGKMDVYNLALNFVPALEQLSKTQGNIDEDNKIIAASQKELEKKTADIESKKKNLGNDIKQYNQMLIKAKTLGNSLVSVIDQNGLRGAKDTKGRDFAGLWNDATTLNSTINSIKQQSD